MPRNSRSKRFARSQSEGLQSGTLQSDLGVSPSSLYAWIKPFGIPAEKHVQQQDLGAEIRRLQAQFKRERVRRRIYANRDDARQDIFDYIEMFYHPVRRQGHNDGLSTVKYEM